MVLRASTSSIPEEFPFVVLGTSGETFTMAVTEGAPDSSDWSAITIKRSDGRIARYRLQEDDEDGEQAANGEFGASILKAEERIQGKMTR